jgi:hypothetical protein
MPCTVCYDSGQRSNLWVARERPSGRPRTAAQWRCLLGSSARWFLSRTRRWESKFAVALCVRACTQFSMKFLAEFHKAPFMVIRVRRCTERATLWL